METPGSREGNRDGHNINEYKKEDRELTTKKDIDAARAKKPAFPGRISDPATKQKI